MTTFSQKFSFNTVLMLLGCFCVSSLSFAKGCNCSKHKKSETQQEQSLPPKTTESATHEQTEASQTSDCTKKKCQHSHHEHKNTEECK